MQQVHHAGIAVSAQIIGALKASGRVKRENPPQKGNDHGL